MYIIYQFFPWDIGKTNWDHCRWTQRTSRERYKISKVVFSARHCHLGRTSRKTTSMKIDYYRSTSIPDNSNKKVPATPTLRMLSTHQPGQKHLENNQIKSGPVSEQVVKAKAYKSAYRSTSLQRIPFLVIFH